MTIRPCDHVINCPCDDSPVRNFSAEQPDPFTHFIIKFPPHFPTINQPTNAWTIPSCEGVCYSEVSLADAEACAIRDAQLCQNTPPTFPPLPMLFGNNALSCQVECPMGPPWVVSVPAGTYLAETQELADLIARSYCLNLAFQTRQCEVPGPGPTPGTPCPLITGTSPASPVNATVGQDVTLSATYTYSGDASHLMFAWFLDATPIAMTSGPSLTLTGVMEADSGAYTLGIYAPGCDPVFSPQIILAVSNCPAESGDPAPDTLDIAHTTSWETWTIDTLDLNVLLSSNPICNPTGLAYVTPANGLDHSPGVYGFRYVSGYIDTSPGLCPPLTPVEGQVGVYQIVDEEANYDSPIVCNLQALAHLCRTMPGDPPPVGNFGGGLVVCGTDATDVQNQLAAFWADKAFTCDPYPPDNTLDFSHTNTGGQFSVYFGDGSVFGVPLMITAIQLSGNIPQPRKLSIDDFVAVSSMFTDPAIGANWNGTFPTRAAYTSSDLRWEAAASGGFGGAKISYITDHPTSANGKGWKIQIYGAGPTLVWQGLKAVDSTSIGIYYRDDSATPNGPRCLVCSDDSATGWSPP